MRAGALVGRGRACSPPCADPGPTATSRRPPFARSSSSTPPPGAGPSCTATASPQRLRATRRARITAVTSGGAIPDNADYPVVLEPEGTSSARSTRTSPSNRTAATGVPARDGVLAHPARRRRRRARGRREGRTCPTSPSGSARRRRGPPSSPPRSPAVRRRPAPVADGPGLVREGFGQAARDAARRVCGRRRARPRRRPHPEARGARASFF